ncbi:unnamed protein product, partial [marine sediment metagenome]
NTYIKSNLNMPILTTIHGILDEEAIKSLEKIHKARKNNKPVYLNTISFSQKKLFEKIFPADFVIYNAIETEAYPFEEKKNNYLFSLGQIHERKGQDTCIDVAKRLEEKLVIAGPLLFFREYIKKFWEEKLEPRMDQIYTNIPPAKIKQFIEEFERSNNQIIYVGELNDAQKKEWFKYSKGFLMPIKFDEPFGLVMIESMACGTPVVAYEGGAVPEIVLNNKTGYVIEKDNFEEFINGVKKIERINPYECRKKVLKNFDIKKQAENYVNIFREIINKR